jgi:FkbM family methyltransferase
MADLAGPEGEVLALEPNPDLYPLLLRGLQANGLARRVRALRRAAGCQEGPALLAVPRLAPGSGSLCLPAAREDGEDTLFHTCRRQRLDDLMAPPVDLVKIDAEGADYDALEGMHSLLEDSPGCTVVLEHCEALFYPGRGGAQLDRALSLGLELAHVAYDGRIMPVTRGEVLAAPERLWNLVLRR